jgi:hypothetical protein
VLIDSLVGAPTEVAEVMVMNVVMSAATAVIHRDAGRDEQAQMSSRTCARAQLLVRALAGKASAVDLALCSLRAVLADTEADEADARAAVAAAHAPAEAEEAEAAWLAFLQRWMYDDDQLAAVRTSLAACD